MPASSFQIKRLPARVRELTTTVPREFVHRTALAEVLPIGWKRLDGANFSVRAQWPRSHSLFAPSALGHYDATLVAETIRQAGLLVCHAGLGVPLGHQFLMHDLAFRVRPGWLRVGPAPAELTIDVACSDIKERAGRVTGMRYDAVLVRDGEFLATGSASTTIIAPQVYGRMRGHRAGVAAPSPSTLPAPAAPGSVGRGAAEDVVLAETGEPNRWLLRVDSRHPVLFDHPVDHTPGMVMLEAARQAAVATIGRPAARIAGMACSFTRYTELDSACVIETCALPVTQAGDSVLVTGRQDGELVFSATVALAAPEAGPGV